MPPLFWPLLDLPFVPLELLWPPLAPGLLEPPWLPAEPWPVPLELSPEPLLPFAELCPPVLPFDPLLPPDVPPEVPPLFWPLLDLPFVPLEFPPPWLPGLLPVEL